MNWIKSRSSYESLGILGQLSETCMKLGGPLSRQLYKLVENKDYLSLVNYEIDYNDAELSVTDVIYSRQILGFFQKCEFLDLGINKEAVAFDRFVEAERICRDTNERFRTYEKDPKLAGPNVNMVLYHASRKIQKVLGDVPELSEFSFAFGSGANTNVKYDLASPRAKLGSVLECSANLAPTVGEFLSETPEWMRLHAVSENETSYTVSVSVVPGKVSLVPKNAKTHRSIELQPLLNSFFQKGVGTYMRERLKRSGIDLHDQSINQNLAMQGCISGKLATVDLRMASDCLSRSVVWNLLPFDWACLLDELRTPEVILPKLKKNLMVEAIQKHRMSDTMDPQFAYRMEKFSSMGNGYTFELESLIFYGLCFGVVEVLGLNHKDVSVYGDDLIIPVEAYGLLEETLVFCGFSLNKEKSFCTGPFRESCGADFFNGFDIRPFYQKTLVSERTLYTMHNWFVRHCEVELADDVRTMCIPHLMLFGPDGFGDGHLIGSFQLRINRTITRRGWDGGYFDTYSLRARRYTGVLPGDSVLPVYSVYTRSGEKDPTDPDVVRGSDGYAKISIYTLVRNIFSPKV